MLIRIFQVLFILLFPAFILFIIRKYKKIGIVGPVLLAYLSGIILTNINVPIDIQLSMTISEIAIPLAIPLILFQTNFLMWVKNAKKTVISFVLVCASAFTASFIISAFFSGRVKEFWKIGGMLTGVYTGGTPNLMAIGTGLDISTDTLIMVNASDVLVGGFFFVIFITIAKPLLSKILLPYTSVSEEGNIEYNTEYSQGKVDFRTILKAFVLALIIAGISVIISLILRGALEVWLVILLITTLSIFASFFKKVRELEKSYDLGNYMLLIFSVAIGTSVDINQILNSNATIILYVFFTVLLAFLLHIILSIIFKIDVDTMIITSVAGIYGPVFVGPVARAIKNKSVILSGITSGLVGYAAGNYLGYISAYILKNIFL